MGILDELKKLFKADVALLDVPSKPWYLSKTLWLNAVAFIALLIQSHYGFIISPTEQLAVITIANLVLRAITGKQLE